MRRTQLALFLKTEWEVILITTGIKYVTISINHLEEDSALQRYEYR